MMVSDKEQIRHCIFFCIPAKREAIEAAEMICRVLDEGDDDS
jgi:hypothetical protein